jgi:hypothetical protein
MFIGLAGAPPDLSFEGSERARLEAMSVATRDPDELLIADMSAPPSLERARESLDIWNRRRASLPIHRRAARREADVMIVRCRERVAAAERERYGGGLTGFIRKMLAGEGPSWRVFRAALLTTLVALVPRRLVFLATAILVTWLLVGLFVLLAIAQAIV